MVIEDVEAFSSENFRLKMLEKNHIDRLLPVNHETIDGKNTLLYDISSLQSVARLYEIQKLNFSALKNLVEGLGQMFSVISEYLLVPEGVVLEPEYIFTDYKTGNMFFCYHPFYEGDTPKDIKKLFEEILQILDYEDEAAVKLAFSLNKLVKNENFVIKDLTDAVADIQGDRYSGEDFTERSVFVEPVSDWIASPVNGLQDRNIKDAAKTREASEQEVSERGVSKKEVLKKEASKKEPGSSFFEKLSGYMKGKSLAEVINDIDEGVIIKKIKEAEPGEKTKTKAKERFGSKDSDSRGINRPVSASLSPAAESFSPAAGMEIKSLGNYFESAGALKEPVHYEIEEGTRLLVQKGTHRLVGAGKQQGVNFNLTSFPFTIGKQSGSVDGVLNEPTISRIHLRIHEDTDTPGLFYLEDMNSTNGTFLNDDQLPAYTKTPLKPGALIRLAEEEFYFR
ncbi:MAG: FHA domain-containing protein [Parasporobacterium sp.]|nr:FHA domain-containing protein [Parasporobacterium sp.]